MKTNKKNNPIFTIGVVIAFICFFIYFSFFYKNTSSLGEGLFSAKKEKGIIINKHIPQKLNWEDSK